MMLPTPNLDSTEQTLLSSSTSRDLRAYGASLDGLLAITAGRVQTFPKVAASSLISVS